MPQKERQERKKKEGQKEGRKEGMKEALSLSLCQIKVFQMARRGRNNIFPLQPGTLQLSSFQP
jgi:hypothetical protein